MVFKGPGVVKEMKKELISILKKRTLKISEKLLELALDPSYHHIYKAKVNFMSKKCELTGISPLKGHNVSHAKNN